MKLVEKKCAHFSSKLFWAWRGTWPHLHILFGAKQIKISSVCISQVFYLLLLMHRKIDQPLTFRLNNWPETHASLDARDLFNSVVRRASRRCACWKNEILSSICDQCSRFVGVEDKPAIMKLSCKGASK